MKIQDCMQYSMSVKAPTHAVLPIYPGGGPGVNYFRQFEKVVPEKKKFAVYY